MQSIKLGFKTLKHLNLYFVSSALPAIYCRLEDSRTVVLTCHNTMDWLFSGIAVTHRQGNETTDPSLVIHVN